MLGLYRLFVETTVHGRSCCNRKMTQKYLTQKSGVIICPDNYPCVDGTGHFAEQISLRDSSILKGCLDRHVLRPSRVRASNDGDHRHLPASPVKILYCVLVLGLYRLFVETTVHGRSCCNRKNDAEVFDAEVGVIICPDNYPCVDGTGHFAEQISLRDSSILKGCLDRHVLSLLQG